MKCWRQLYEMCSNVCSVFYEIIWTLIQQLWRIYLKKKKGPWLFCCSPSIKEKTETVLFLHLGAILDLSLTIVCHSLRKATGEYWEAVQSSWFLQQLVERSFFYQEFLPTRHDPLKVHRTNQLIEFHSAQEFPTKVKLCFTWYPRWKTLPAWTPFPVNVHHDSATTED